MQQPFYYGEMLVKGEMWLHNYPPIITRETFMACTEVRLGWNKKPFKYGGKDFLFRGLITCATTGKIVTSEIHSKTYSNGKVDQWVYLAAWDPKNPNEKRLNSLIDLRLNGELSTEEFQAKKQQLKDRQYEINRY
ncbi:SHOCT domain-containing protein [Candidatus Tisiphia endosymbiont of Sialis lutaria]|uniref:SHOCT domain-containing protein n=1 Tax=Candidatus Tisiphia endosymbiont of Sialis lutaria TaxID=2029164 RepID=UPI00312CBF7D